MGGNVDDLLSAGLTMLDAESGASLALLDTAADRGEEAPEAALPERLGRYRVLERLGAGGMGVVVAAYDPELDRKVAIKLIHAGRGDDEARARLLREAQAMARLAHPNVVAVHDVGVFAGQVFVAMEFVRGETLGAWLKRAPRGWSEVLAVFVSAGRGLAAAHDAGLVHRDFKPKSECLPQTPPLPPSGRILADRGDLRGAVCRVMPRHAAVLATGWQRGPSNAGRARSHVSRHRRAGRRATHDVTAALTVDVAQRMKSSAFTRPRRPDARAVEDVELARATRRPSRSSR